MLSGPERLLLSGAAIHALGLERLELVGSCPLHRRIRMSDILLPPPLCCLTGTSDLAAEPLNGGAADPKLVSKHAQRGAFLPTHTDKLLLLNRQR